jgi:predicted phage tail protein
LSEGPIVGPVNGAKSVYFDGVQLVSDDGTPNFEDWSVAGNAGWPDQPVLSGFAAQQAETAVGLQVKKATPLTRTIVDPNADRARVTVSVPALQVQNTSTGNITGSSVVFNVLLQSNGGGYALVTQHTISGKTNTRYQRALTFPLVGNPPWDIRIQRVTDDSTLNTVQNDLYWDSYTSIIDAKVNYTLSAVIGVTIDAEQFQAIPKRAYDIEGLIISVPSNYDPRARTYTGTWDGTFAQEWTNNPAWVLYDLVVQNRYGIGDFIDASEVDKWALYRIAQWCDQNVSDGKGGVEPRFTCNIQISTQVEAFDLLATIAGIFRGFTYWAGGQMIAVADMPSDAVAIYNNSNVLEGTFNYHGADIRARHNYYRVSWQDQTLLGETRISPVEGEPEAISRYGLQPQDIAAAGCTSESQAIRTGKWGIYTDTYEGETVDFVVGLDGAWSRPGDVIRVADINIGGQRRGGRLVAATTTKLTLDEPFQMVSGVNYNVSVVMPSGLVESRYVNPTVGKQSNLTVTVPFSVAPLPDSWWVVTSSDLEATWWRVLSAKMTDNDRYEMTAMTHRPDKWDYIEKNIALSEPDITNIGGIADITNLNAKDYLVALSPISIGVRMLISWTSSAPSFEVAYRPQNGNWIRARVDQSAHDVAVEDGFYDIWVTPINLMGRRGITLKTTYEVIGKSAPPANVQNFRIQVVGDVAMFQWAPAADIDVIIGGSFEIRYSPRTSGASWISSNPALTSIPGTATSVELPYRPGTYLIRARDIGGIFSPQAALVTSEITTTAKQFIRICESPTWPGVKTNVQVQMPQEWLIITNEEAGLGTYLFANEIDMGGVFPVILSVDMLAFPFYENDIYIDQRPGLVDDWQDWDSSQDDGRGMVTVQVRQTDNDPASGSAVWGPWANLVAGEYRGRGFEFRALLSAPSGQNVAIEQLCVIADVSAKLEEGANIVWVPNKQRINFTVKFFYTPAISIAVQSGATGDQFRITNKSRTGFDIELLNSANAPITAARTFDWIASGY